MIVRSLLTLAVLIALVSPAGADALRCRNTIIKASARHAQAVANVLSRCADRLLTGRLPPSADCTADPGLAPAASKLAAAIADACCGADGACGTMDDEPLGAIGWDVGQCPDFNTRGCDMSITGPADVATCLTCLARTGGAWLLELSLESLEPSVTGSALAGCQRVAGREIARYLRSASRALARCWDARSRGRHANACPDPGDGRATETLARAAATLSSRLTSACVGQTPAQITSLTHCPAVTVPGGTDCARPLATLADLVACLGCVAGFEGTCVDQAAVPAFTPYPPECNPPPGMCSAGVMCETSLECPSGYTCRDNGGDTRYCVGGTCAGDDDCGGGGVCRQYCTVSGCESPRCQCAGFGCTGPDELCLDDGGLACRKLCTQDSDCTEPFGLVCVNPGFGFGVCIGQTPCQ